MCLLWHSGCNCGLAMALLIRFMWEVPSSNPNPGTEYTDADLMFYLSHFWHVPVILYHKMGPSSRFEVLAAVTLKIIDFRYLTPCTSPKILPPSSWGRRLHGVISQKTMSFEAMTLSFPISHSQPPYNWLCSPNNAAINRSKCDTCATVVLRLVALCNAGSLYLISLHFICRGFAQRLMHFSFIDMKMCVSIPV